MKETIENTEWGKIYYYNDDNFRYALYTYNDDKDTAYLSNVKVNKNSRGQGIGNKILDNVKTLAQNLNTKYICLLVLKNSWMHDWYGRHGFVDLCYNEDDSKYIWMRYDIEK